MNSPIPSPVSAQSQIDNLLRRELRIGDPGDPSQVARALADRYQTSARAQAIEGEARGLPFLHTPIVRSPGLAVQTASDIDLEQARNDVQADLEELLRSGNSKDVRPELEGWQQIILRSVEEGVASARMGLDPQRRDTAFAMRRQLGEYARLARLVGALTPELNRLYRSLALSLDEVSSVLLVLMGESMANVGFSGGRFLLQVPYAELQARRDAVLNALRLVEGASVQAAAPGHWPRGLRAYRTLSQQFEVAGQGELRSLLNEAEMSRTLDQLVQLASGGTPYGLRSIGASSWAPVNRLYRFVQTTLTPVAKSSPELAGLHEAMMLFLSGFAAGGGFRLLRVARPTMLNYGHYGSANITRAEQRLIELANLRGRLARQLDNLTQCACDEERVLTQVVLDGVLYGVDRAIDYYCLGSDDEDFGVPEARAAAWTLIIDALLPTDPEKYPMPAWGTPPNSAVSNCPWPAGQDRPDYLTTYLSANDATTKLLDALRSLLRPRAAGPYPEDTWWDPQYTEAEVTQWILGNAPWPAAAGVGVPLAGLLKQELALVKQTDQEWLPVVSQMTSGYVPVERVFGKPSGCLVLVVDRAIGFLVSATAQLDVEQRVTADSMPATLTMPMHIEDSLQLIAAKL